MIIFSFVIVVEMSSNCLKILPFSIFMDAHYHFGYCIDFEGLRLWGFTFLLIFFPGLIFYVCLLRFKIKELFFFCSLMLPYMFYLLWLFSIKLFLSLFLSCQGFFSFCFVLIWKKYRHFVYFFILPSIKIKSINPLKGRLS
jgi:hypothetical protein